MNKASKGFTLIELVVVITILGILAAFAIPRFAGLETEARIAAIQGAAGSVRSAATLAHSLQLAQGLAADASVTMEGSGAITMVFGYPTEADIALTLMDTSGFDTGTAGLIQKEGAPTPATCAVTYTEVAAAGNAPVVSTLIAGC